MTSRTDFDPADLLPYDAEAFRTISRTECSLGIGDQLGYAMAHGSLLDQWNRIDFDPDTRLLRAYAYRPVGGGGAPTAGHSTSLVEQCGVGLEVEICP